MDETKMARCMRLAAVQTLFRQGFLDKEGAKDSLMGNLNPDDNRTYYDDSSLFNDEEKFMELMEQAKGSL